MTRRFQVYIHVPYCSRRCGYCDFNTYVARPAQRAAFKAVALAEMELAAAVPRPPAATVYFGGGTPTLLPAEDLGELLGGVRRLFGLAPGAEVTCEANPDTVDRRYLDALAESGFTRLSVGAQSAVPAVLRTLDREHTASRVPQAEADARAAGLAVSADLIYGTPGESLADWRLSLESVLGFDHVSAYALTLEPHTPLARRIKAGAVAEVDPDFQAEAYELADRLLGAAGLAWYEISNWARDGFECQHNLGYWGGADWLGIGPGAHSALGQVRSWNHKSPARHAKSVLEGVLPVDGSERLDAEQLELERVMLRLRTARGLELGSLAPDSAAAAKRLEAEGLVTVRSGRLSLTLSGRLLADTVTRALMFV
jgi:oxygen-independent coproporphyrinogen-3 oxidase